MFNVKNRRAGKVRGTKIKSDEKGRGNRKKIDVPGVGGGLGQNNLTGTLLPFFLKSTHIHVLCGLQIDMSREKRPILAHFLRNDNSPLFSRSNTGFCCHGSQSNPSNTTDCVYAPTVTKSAP